MTNIELLSQQLADAEATLEVASASHKHANDRANAIRARMAELECRRQELQVRRVNGAASQGDQAELLLLGGDLQLLAETLREAEQEAATFDLNAMRAAYDTARHALDRAAADERLAMLLEKAKECEALFIRLCAAVQDAGREVGKPNLSQCWLPSREFRLLVGREWAPA